jgi:hypothetical protein
MLDLVGPIFLLVPLKSHAVIRSYNRRSRSRK